MPTADRHVPHRIRQTKCLHSLWAGWPLADHNFFENDQVWEPAERTPSCKSLWRHSDVGQTIHLPPPPRPGVTTNLYHNHAESKYISSSCDFINSFENLWRDPCPDISVPQSCGARPMNNRRKLEIRQTGVTVVIDEDAALVASVIDEA